MKFSFVFIAPFLLLYCSKDQSSSNQFLRCDEEIIKYEIILDNPIEVDLSKIHKLYLKNGNLFFSLLGMNPKAIIYNTSKKEFSSVGKSGRGPFEFIAVTTIINDDKLYFYDGWQYKFAAYDLIKEKFITEKSLDEKLNSSGIFKHAGSNELFMVWMQRKGDDIINNIISFNYDFAIKDTLYRWVDNSYIRFRESTFEYASQFPLFKNKFLEFTEEGELLIFNNETFSYRTLDEGQSEVEINYDYAPDYNFYIDQRRNSNKEFNESSGLINFNKALENNDQEFVAKYSDVLTGGGKILFTLFAKRKNAYLLANRSTGETNVICSDTNYKPVLIHQDSIYWVTHEDRMYYRLIKSEL